jgi:integrase
MSSSKITKRTVDDLECPPGKDRIFLWDDSLSGFGVAAFPSRKGKKGKKVYVVQYRQDGRSRRSKIGEHGRLTPDEARSMAKKALGAVEGGADLIAERKKSRDVRSFREVGDDFLVRHAEAKRKPRTAEEYRRVLKLHVYPAIGSTRIVDVTHAAVARMHSSLAATPALANKAVAIISSVWRWASRHDGVSKHANPAEGIERYPEERRERFLTPEELGRLGDTLRDAETVGLPGSGPKAMSENRRFVLNPHAVAAIRLLILTGARLREILDLEWTQVDIERGMLFLPTSKTGRKTVYLAAAALAVLDALPRVKGNPHVIASLNGTARSDLKRPWASVSAAAGLPGLRLHDLRHSFASIGAGASLGLPIIGKLLGHSQPATTARYAHLDADPMRKAANAIGATIADALSRKVERAL